MERANIDGRTAAARLGWSTSRVSRLLTGNRVAQDCDVAAFLALCGVTGPERDRLLRLSTDVDTAGGFGAWLPKQMQGYIEYESRASAITTFEAFLVPNLLRIDDYARAVVSRDANIPPGQIDEWVAATAARRVMFTRADPPAFALFLHEHVLRLPVGGQAVMFDQSQHLVHMAQRPYITIRVIPAELGAHAGAAGSFVLLESPQYQPTIHLDGAVTGQFLDEQEHVDAYRAVLTDLSNAALSERESTDLIAATAQKYASTDLQHTVTVIPSQHRVVDLGRIRQTKGAS